MTLTKEEIDAQFDELVKKDPLFGQALLLDELTFQKYVCLWIQAHRETLDLHDRRMKGVC